SWPPSNEDGVAGAGSWHLAFGAKARSWALLVGIAAGVGTSRCRFGPSAMTLPYLRQNQRHACRQACLLGRRCRLFRNAGLLCRRRAALAHDLMEIQRLGAPLPRQHFEGILDLKRIARV